MKKIKKYFFLALFFVLSPLAFLACNETAFNDIPWGASSMAIKDIIESATSSKNVMIESGLPVIYETTTTYTFRQTLNNDFQDREIRDEKTTTLSNWNSQNAVAKIENSRYIDDILVSFSTEYYVKYQGQTGTSCYLYISETEITEGVEVTSLRRENYSTVDNPFLTLLNDIIYDTSESEVSVVNEKIFEEDTYYRLSSQVGELAIINAKFSENDDIFSNPSMFELYNQTEDYVISFSCEYALNSAEYLKYFALSYDVERSNGVPHERETYLSVNSTTSLVDYGRNISLPSAPENVDIYTVSGFKDCVMADNSYISYRDSATTQGLYNEYSVYRNGEDYMFNMRSYNSQTAIGETTHYYASRTESGYTIYQINIEDGTYFATTGFNPLFLSFDYSGNLLNSNVEQGTYQFGTNEAYIEIGVQNNEIYSVKTQNSSLWYVLEYSVGMPSDEVFYDIDDLVLIESE